MTFQVADVVKPLASSARITSKGHRIVLDDYDNDTYILHKSTGKKIKLHKKGNVLIIKLTILPPGDGDAGHDN